MKYFLIAKLFSNLYFLPMENSFSLYKPKYAVFKWICGITGLQCCYTSWQYALIFSPIKVTPLFYFYAPAHPYYILFNTERSLHIFHTIADMANNAAYINSWLSVFKGDTRILIKAALRAQQAVEYILNPKMEEPLPVSNDEPELEMELEEV
jgi:hypothetical protein